MHLRHRSAHNETLPPITSTAVTLDFFFLLYLTGGDDLHGDRHVHDSRLVCLFVGADVAALPSPTLVTVKQLHAVCLQEPANATQRQQPCYNAGTMPVSF